LPDSDPCRADAGGTGGRCVFVMPTDGDFSNIAKAVKPL